MNPTKSKQSHQQKSMVVSWWLGSSNNFDALINATCKPPRGGLMPVFAVWGPELNSFGAYPLEIHHCSIIETSFKKLRNFHGQIFGNIGQFHPWLEPLKAKSWVSVSIHAVKGAHKSLGTLPAILWSCQRSVKPAKHQSSTDWSSCSQKQLHWSWGGWDKSKNQQNSWIPSHTGIPGFPKGALIKKLASRVSPTCIICVLAIAQLSRKWLCPVLVGWVVGQAQGHFILAIVIEKWRKQRPKIKKNKKIFRTFRFMALKQLSPK